MAGTARIHEVIKDGEVVFTGTLKEIGDFIGCGYEKVKNQPRDFECKRYVHGHIVRPIGGDYVHSGLADGNPNRPWTRSGRELYERMRARAAYEREGEEWNP